MAGSEAMRDEKMKVLRAVRASERRGVIRGQYAGYRQEEGVDPRSDVETYAALRFDIDSWRWADVPFYVRAGKSLERTATEVIVELKAPPQVVFHEAAPAMGNYVRFRLGPDVVIALGASAKRAGEDMTGQPTDRPCPPERAQGDADFLDALNAVTNWRREGDFVRLIGPKTLLFRVPTN